MFRSRGIFLGPRLSIKPASKFAFNQKDKLLV